MAASIDASALKARIAGPGELAILDVRERGAFGRGHLLLASSVPLGRLEFTIADLVPRRGTPIVVCDASGGEAERAARRLESLGYDSVEILDGGVEGWARAGYRVFTGVNVPSKAFGEVVEHACGTPHVAAAALRARLDAGERIVVLDSRPIEEFRAMCIPGGIAVPGAELVYRVHDLAPDPAVTVVVNCAGRTRGIIGAQSLINAGLPNPVLALENGTMGWNLAGLALEHRQKRAAPPPSPKGLAAARAAAGRVAARHGVPRLYPPGLERLRAEAETHTLYVFDVRTRQEFEAGHLPDALWAPGGQLVQGADDYMATRGARVVLVDDVGVRAALTASWLLQMGWAHVWTLALEDGADLSLDAGPRAPRVLDVPAGEPTLSIEALRQRRRDAAVVDLRPSPLYRAGHIPGAWFALRSRLAGALSALAPAPALVLVSEDGVLARFAAAECRALWPGEVAALEGGMAAWTAAGLELEFGGERWASRPDDVYPRPYDRGTDVEQAMRDYLDWEVGLVDQVRADGDAGFRIVTHTE